MSWTTRHKTIRMKPMLRTKNWANFAGFIIAVGFLQEAFAAPTERPKVLPKAKEIRVQLFGQPCLLSGPHEETILKAIHSISPEQLPPPQSQSQVKQTLDKLKNLPPLPIGLDRYRDQLNKRLEAQLNFYDGLTEAKRSGKVNSIISRVSHDLTSRRLKEFESQLVAQNQKEGVSSWGNSTIVRLNENFLEALDENPDEEFHRAILKMNVRYDCSMESEEEE